MFRVTLSATQLWEEQSTRWLWNKSRFHFKDFEWCRARPSPTWCVALSVTKCDEWKLYLLWNEIDFVWRWLINAVAERRTWRSKTNLNRNVAVLNCQKWISGDVIWDLLSRKKLPWINEANKQVLLHVCFDTKRNIFRWWAFHWLKRKPLNWNNLALIRDAIYSYSWNLVTVLC